MRQKCASVMQKMPQEHVDSVLFLLFWQIEGFLLNLGIKEESTLTNCMFHSKCPDKDWRYVLRWMWQVEPSCEPYMYTVCASQNIKLNKIFVCYWMAMACFCNLLGIILSKTLSDIYISDYIIIIISLLLVHHTWNVNYINKKWKTLRSSYVLFNVSNMKLTCGANLKETLSH